MENRLLKRLVNGISALTVSTATLLSSGCQMCGESEYYDYGTYPSYCQQVPYYQSAPCFQQPQYFQQIPCQPIYNGNQAVNQTPIYNGNGANNAPVINESKTAPAAMPPKPVPEEIQAPQPMPSNNSRPLKPINKTA